jgi:hypothetical protein
MSQPSSPLRDSLALLADLRKEMEDLLPAVNWASRCHADTEVLAFIQLVIGNVAAIEVLAKADVRLVVAGTAASRAPYEEVVTAAWMVWTDDLAERDRRWMALFVDEEKFWRTMVDEAVKRKDRDELIKDLQRQGTRATSIIAQVQPQLAVAGVGRVEQMPSFDKRLEQVGQPHYVVYKTACQFTHPATRSLALVRDLGDAHSNDVPVADYGYRTTERDWTTAILLGAESLWFGLETLATRMGAPPVTPRARGLFNAIVDKVRTFR